MTSAYQTRSKNGNLSKNASNLQDHSLVRRNQIVNTGDGLAETNIGLLATGSTNTAAPSLALIRCANRLQNFG